MGYFAFANGPMPAGSSLFLETVRHWVRYIRVLYFNSSKHFTWPCYNLYSVYICKSLMSFKPWRIWQILSSLIAFTIYGMPRLESTLQLCILISLCWSFSFLTTCQVVFQTLKRIPVSVTSSLLLWCSWLTLCCIYLSDNWSSYLYWLWETLLTLARTFRT